MIINQSVIENKEQYDYKPKYDQNLWVLLLV